MRGSLQIPESPALSEALNERNNSKIRVSETVGNPVTKSGKTQFNPGQVSTVTWPGTLKIQASPGQFRGHT